MAAQSKIPLARGAEFEQNAVGERSYLVELRVDSFAKSVAAFDGRPDVPRSRFSCKLSQQTESRNERPLHPDGGRSAPEQVEYQPHGEQSQQDAGNAVPGYGERRLH